MMNELVYRIIEWLTTIDLTLVHSFFFILLDKYSLCIFNTHLSRERVEEKD